MIEINNKKECCGCTACYTICPKKCIQMLEDNEGFKYPHVNKEKCINCRLCDKVCPILNKTETCSEKKAYIVRTKNKEVLENSTSGGFFSPLSEYIINKNGWVYGVIFNNDFEVIHYGTDKKKEVYKFRGSKYVQSNLNNIFSEIKMKLDSKTLVLFSGTPCQIEGLKNYLKFNYDNLVTLDVICHGTPSPKLWRMYIEKMSKKYHSKIAKVNFRNKTYGYHCGTMMIEFENGKKYYGSARTDVMLKSFFEELSSRPACYDCKFKTRNHRSDFTVYDSWNVNKLNNRLKDDDKGFTNLIVNTKKGEEILEKLKKSLECYESDFEKAIKYDGIMVEHSAIENKYRNVYYNEIDNLGVEKNLQKYVPIKFYDKIIEKSKIIFYKLGLIKIIRKMKG